MDRMLKGDIAEPETDRQKFFLKRMLCVCIGSEICNCSEVFYTYTQ